jgi:hypothetical protein
VKEIDTLRFVRTGVDQFPSAQMRIDDFIGYARMTRSRRTRCGTRRGDAWFDLTRSFKRRGEGKEKARLLALSPDRKTLVAGRVSEGDERATVLTLHDRTGRAFARLPPFENWLGPTSLAFREGGKVLVTWSGDVVSWDVPSGRELGRLKPPGAV